MKNLSVEVGERKEYCHYFMEPINKEQSGFKLTSLCNNDGTQIKEPKYRPKMELFMCEHHYKKIVELSNE